MRGGTSEAAGATDQEGADADVQVGGPDLEVVRGCCDYQRFGESTAGGVGPRLWPRARTRAREWMLSSPWIAGGYGMRLRVTVLPSYRGPEICSQLTFSCG